MVLRKLVSLAVPGGVALAAFLHAQAIGALIESSALTGAPPASVAPFAEARAATAPEGDEKKSARAILERNPFDHATKLVDVPTLALADTSNPFTAPPCEGVRAVATVTDTNVEGSFAALQLADRHVLRKRGGEIDDLKVVYVAADRVWLEKNGTLCQATVFGERATPASSPSPSTPSSAGAAPQSPLEKEVTSKIKKTGQNEYEVDRGALDKLLEAQAELMRTPLVPMKEGERVVGFRLVRVKPGSVLSAIGLETNDTLMSINGIEVTSTERMIEAYARLKGGNVDRLTLNVTRNGKPTNLDYVIR